MEHGEGLKRRIEARSARVGVIGLGYVGLPLAVEFARAGFRVSGVEIDPEKVEQINRGHSFIADVEEADLAAVVAAGRLQATTDPDALGTTDAVVICVPTPFNRNKEPDLSAVMSAGEAIARRLRPGQLVVLESSTYPGTTEEVLRPLLESSGLRAGRDFFLAYSPERVDPGNPTFRIPNIPKVVGGVDPASTALGCALYAAVVVRTLPVSSPRVAEMAKLLENIFRNVNIALVNELAMLSDRMGIDIWEVIETAATKPFGFMSFQPGPGVGGHCLPVDPVYLAWKAKEYDFYTNFITLAAEVNANMPYFVARKVVTTLVRRTGQVAGASVLVLGVTFKRDVNDIRNSSAVKLLELLEGWGLRTAYHDPLVPELRVGEATLKSEPLTAERLAAADCVLIHTDHSSYDYDWIVAHAPLVFDTRNATRAVQAERERIVRL